MLVYKFAFTLHGECEYAKEQHFVDMTAVASVSVGDALLPLSHIQSLKSLFWINHKIMNSPLYTGYQYMILN